VGVVGAETIIGIASNALGVIALLLGLRSQAQHSEANARVLAELAAALRPDANQIRQPIEDDTEPQSPRSPRRLEDERG
jgi:hypothetical protein